MRTIHARHVLQGAGSHELHAFVFIAAQALEHHLQRNLIGGKPTEREAEDEDEEDEEQEQEQQEEEQQQPRHTSQKGITKRHHKKASKKGANRLTVCMGAWTLTAGIDQVGGNSSAAA